MFISTFDIFREAAERFSKAEAEIIPIWRSGCNCHETGELKECWNCPYYKNLGLLTQRKLYKNPGELCAEIPPPQSLDPYSDEVKQQCLEMYNAGYFIDEIQNLVGVPSRRVLRNWLREFGVIAGRSAQYSEELKQTCLKMYADHCTPRQIENETGVPADTVTDWAMHANLSRPKKYSDEVKQTCLSLYQEGLSSEQIHEEMGMNSITIRSWINQAEIGRGQKHYSQTQIEECLNFYKQGKTPKEIEVITQIKQATIRSWIRKHRINKQNNWTETTDNSQLTQATIALAPLKHKRKHSGYWKDFENVKQEILDINQQRGQLGMMPMAEQLKQLGRLDLSKAISKHHGGFQSVAEQLGLEFKKKRAGYWSDFTNVEKHLLDFITKHSSTGIMPTKQDLEEAGESALAAAMNLHGGFPKVANRLGLVLSYNRKQRDYWKDIDNFKNELLQVVEQIGTPGLMPTHEQLTEIGRTDLIAAIASNGGWPSVARRVGLTYIKHYNNPNDYF